MILPFLKSSSFAERRAALAAMEVAPSPRLLKDFQKFLKVEQDPELRGRLYTLVRKLELQS